MRLVQSQEQTTSVCPAFKAEQYLCRNSFVIVYKQHCISIIVTTSLISDM